jgi:hypothetical protein
MSGSSAPETCPNCDAPRSSLYIAEDRRLTCRLCGHKVSRIKPLTKPEPDSSAEKPSRIAKLKPPEKQTVTPGKVPRRTNHPVTEGITHSEPLSHWATARYSTALQLVREKKYDEALQAFFRVLDEDRNFLDVHLWIARLTEDAAQRREHLSVVLAQQPVHLEAVREMMLLNGQLTEEEAARSADSYYQPGVESPDVPVSVQAQQVKCRVCGGEMTTSEDGKESYCAFCGHREPLTRQADYGLKSVMMAMVKRRGQETVWAVGEHLLQCKSCGAERTLPAQHLATRCPFCGSKYVIETDALNSFQQPDGVLPFTLSRDQAEEAIDTARAKHIDLEGIYVPCWLFDAALQVNRTIVDRSSQRDPFGKPHANLAYRQETLSDMAHDVPVYAVKSPSPRLLDALGRSDYDSVVPYESGLLATHTALIYAIDFDKASLMVRDKISALMREQHSEDMNQDTQVTVSSLVQQMFYRLVLIPVWVATITEEDGDLRPCLVHGQTGKVARGKARKP